MKFKDAYRAANDSVHVRDTLKAQIQERYERETAPVPQARENRRRWFVAIPTAVAAAAAVFASTIRPAVPRSSRCTGRHSVPVSSRTAEITSRPFPPGSDSRSSVRWCGCK